MQRYVKGRGAKGAPHIVTYGVYCGGEIHYENDPPLGVIFDGSDGGCWQSENDTQIEDFQEDLVHFKGGGVDWDAVPNRIPVDCVLLVVEGEDRKSGPIQVREGCVGGFKVLHSGG